MQGTAMTTEAKAAPPDGAFQFKVVGDKLWIIRPDGKHGWFDWPAGSDDDFCPGCGEMIDIRCEAGSKARLKLINEIADFIGIRGVFDYRSTP